MPTILSHPAVPLALGLGLGTRIVPRPLLVAGMVASILPDLDVVGLQVGVAYADVAGHRGISHSLVFALLMGALAFFAARYLEAKRLTAFLFVFVATASHGLLDMLTNGGMGIALFWPLSDERLFFPVRVIQVSPIGVSRFFSSWGLAALRSELQWVWLPALSICVVILFARRKLLRAA